MKINCQLPSFKIIPFTKICPDTTVRNPSSGRGEEPALTPAPSRLGSCRMAPGDHLYVLRSGRPGFPRARICGWTLTCPPAAPRIFFYILLENNALAPQEGLSLPRLFVPVSPRGSISSLRQSKMPMNTMQTLAFIWWHFTLTTYSNAVTQSLY